MKLNIGCGFDYKYQRDWVNLDVTKPCNVMADANEGLPFRDRSFDLVWASHILEHVPDLRAIQRELARVIKKGGELEVIVPYYLSVDAWGDPTHCRAFSEDSFQSVFWAGFNVTGMLRKDYKRKSSGTTVTWLHVSMRRNEMDYSEVRRRIGGRNYSKG